MLGLVVFLACAFPAIGADSPQGPRPFVPPTTSTPLSTERNMERLFHIRTAFQKHPLLGPLNLGLDYQDGVLTLWGPVPNQERIGLAKSFGQGLKGVSQIKSDLYVGPTGERAGPGSAAMLAPEPPVLFQAASPGPSSSLAPSAATPKAIPPAEPKLALPTGWNGSTLAGPKPELVPSGQVMRLPDDPVAASPAPQPQPSAWAPGQGASGLAKSPPRPASLSPSERLLQVRSSHARFQGIVWILKGDRLEIFHGPGEIEAAMEFAKQAQSIPGIRSLAILSKTP